MGDMYRFEIIVTKYNTYGDRVVRKTPASICAENTAELTSKVREAFGASYDDFRGFWSHGWSMVSMSSEPKTVTETKGAR